MWNHSLFLILNCVTASIYFFVAEGQWLNSAREFGVDESKESPKGKELERNLMQIR